MKTLGARCVAATMTLLLSTVALAFAFVEPAASASGESVTITGATLSRSTGQITVSLIMVCDPSQPGGNTDVILAISESKTTWVGEHFGLCAPTLQTFTTYEIGDPGETRFRPGRAKIDMLVNTYYPSPDGTFTYDLGGMSTSAEVVVRPSP